MKVLTINWCHDIGSTGKIINDIEEALPEIEFYHVYEYYGKVRNSHVFRLSCRPIYRLYLAWARLTGRRYDTGLIPTIKLLAIIKRVKPDVVHVHCPNASSINIFMMFRFLKRKQIKTVVSNHAEYFYTGNCPHAFECKKYQSGCGKCPDIWKSIESFFFDRTAIQWKKMYESFCDFGKLTMVAVSPWQLERMNTSPITKDVNKTVIYNGVDSSVFRYMSESDYKKSFREKYDIGEKKVILQVTAYFSDNKDDDKGGYYFIELARMMEKQNYIFVVAGGCFVERKDQLPTNMVLLGNISNQVELAQLYNLADVTVVTSRRETFGMCCAESLCCGTPVVGFCNGGSESIAISPYSSFVPLYGDLDGLIDAIKRGIEISDRISKEEISSKAIMIYSKEKMAEGYRELYEY